MKRIVTLFFGLLASLSLAFAYNAEMVVKSNNGPFLLKINGRTFNRTPQSQVIIPDLQAGNHHIAMRMVDGRQKTLQFDRVYLPQNERVIFTLVRRGRDMMTLQKTASEPIRQYTPSTRPRQAGPRGNGNAYGQNKGRGQGQYQNADYCAIPMHQGDFQQALKAVYNSRGSENQFRTAKQIVRTTCLSSRQLSKLLKAMNHEDHILQVAKLGWERVVDPENFRIVEQQISRRAYQRSLQDYMGHHPRFAPKNSPPQICQPCRNGSCGAHGSGTYYQEEPQYDDRNYNDQYHQPQRLVSEQEFRGLLRDMRQANYDKDKLQIGKRIAEQYPLSSEHIRQMLGTISYDSYRLKLAKHAYRHVVDPENFYIVKGAFSYSSYKRQLEEFIR
ncbi:MAG: DUF4476 domain-containing protein [Bacteroidia bacterium]